MAWKWNLIQFYCGRNEPRDRLHFNANYLRLINQPLVVRQTEWISFFSDFIIYCASCDFHLVLLSSHRDDKNSFCRLLMKLCCKCFRIMMSMRKLFEVKLMTFIRFLKQKGSGKGQNQVWKNICWGIKGLSIKDNGKLRW